MLRFIRRSLFASIIALAASSGLAVAQDAQKDPPKDFEKDENGSFQKQRMAWFYNQRAYPHKTVPPGARLRAFQQFEARLAAEQGARARVQSPGDVGNWQLIGPATMNGYWGPNSGRVTAVAVDYTNDQIVYAGAAQGGIWKSTNGGTTWTPLTDTQASLATGSIAIDPQNHLTIYVGTGEENNAIDSYYGEGILKSTDGGNTWTNIPGPFAGGGGGGARIGGLAVQPNNSSVVLAAVGCCATGPSGVYRSADAGQTWTQVLNASYAEAYNVIFDPHSPNTAYASVDSNGVYKSTDGGNTWVAVNGSGATALPLSGNGRVAIAMDPNTTTTLWAAIASNTNNNLAGLFRTTDGGISWNKLSNTPDFCNGQCWYDLALAVQPGNSNVIFAGGSQSCCGSVVQSVDGGTNWTIYSNIHPDAHAFVFTPDGTTLYVGNDGGMWSTNQPTNTNITWTNLNTGLATEQFYPGMSIDAANVNIAFAGTQDNATEAFTGTTTWNSVACGDGGVTLIDDTTDPITVYTNCIENSFYKSTDGGQTFNQAQNGINLGDNTNWTPPAAMDPSNSQRLYFGTDRVYQTTNAAGLWTAISPTLTTDGYLTALAVSPVNPDVVWAGSNPTTVSVTQNSMNGAAASWNSVTGGNGGLPSRYITALAADPRSAGTAYVTFSGFSGYGDNLGHVFMTTNLGASWKDISGNLPNIPADDIVIDPQQANTIYLATDFGVFYTTNGGAAWGTLVTGLPRVAVLSLKLHPSRNLFAATHGRSVWETNVASVTSIPSIVSISPPSLVAGAAATTLSITGGAFTSAATAQWNGADLTTTYVSATQLTAVVPAGDLVAAGTAELTVIIPGGSASNQFPVAINNPVPSTASLSPASALVGGSSFTMTVNGSNFIAASSVQWNGVGLATTFVSSTRLTAVVPSNDIASTGTATVVVSNPAPGGGTSSPGLTFAVTVPSSTALTSSVNPANLSQNVTLTATVSPGGATGTVTFESGVTNLGTAPLVGGVATLVTSALPSGMDSLSAIYSGDNTYFTSTGSFTEQVACSGVTQPALYSDSTGAPQSLNVVAASPSCAWTLSTLFPWIQLSATSGTGPTTLTVTSPANTTGADLTGSITFGNLTLPVTERFTAQVFSDVVPSYYDFDAVNLLSTEGITNGCATGEFCPTVDIIRSQMAIFLVRAILHTDNFPYSMTPVFSDVPVGSFGFQWIQKLAELGITNGCATGLFCPTANVTRAQMAVFLIRMRYGGTYDFDFPSTPYFTDVGPSTFGWSWIQRMKEDNITSGCTVTTYCPANPVTRGDMATFVMRGAFNQLLPPNEPVLLSISPATITHGGAPATYTITGLNTNFVDGVTTLGALPGITAGTVTVVNSTTLTVQLSAASGAALEPLSPLAITGAPPGNEEAVLPNGLVVQ